MTHRRNFVRTGAALVGGTLLASRGLASTLSTPADNSSNWPCWRGPARDSTLPEAAWPDSLSESNLVLRWTKPLGKSYSGPVVSNGMVFVTESTENKFESTLALNLADGNQLWRTSWEGSMSVPFFAASNGNWIRSTPAFSGGKLWVGGMKDYLTCLDAASGKTIYEIDFTKRFESKLPDFGQVCSPLVEGESLYIQSGGGLVCLDCASGETRWRSLVDGGGMNGSAFSSPVLTELHGVKQLIVQTRSDLCGVQPSDGTVLWKRPIEAFRGMNILTPTIWNNKIFTSSYGGKSLLLDVARDSSGQWTVEPAWENKSQGYMSSPVVIGDHVYLHLRNQRFTCIDLNTGKEAWTTQPYGKYWSMITNGKSMLALDETGMLYLIRANTQSFELMDSRRVSDQESWAHLAIAGDQVLVRHLEGISCYNWA